MKLRFTFLSALLTGNTLGHAQIVAPTQTNPDSMRVVWADVDRFWQAYDQLATAATTADSVPFSRRVI